MVHLLNHGNGEALGSGVGSLGFSCCLGGICGSGSGFGGLGSKTAGKQGGNQTQGQDQRNNLFHIQNSFFNTELCGFWMGTIGRHHRLPGSFFIIAIPPCENKKSLFP